MDLVRALNQLHKARSFVIDEEKCLGHNIGGCSIAWSEKMPAAWSDDQAGSPSIRRSRKPVAIYSSGSPKRAQ
jgi:hypothetical protein